LPPPLPQNNVIAPVAPANPQDKPKEIAPILPPPLPQNNVITPVAPASPQDKPKEIAPILPPPLPQNNVITPVAPASPQDKPKEIAPILPPPLPQNNVITPGNSNVEAVKEKESQKEIKPKAPMPIVPQMPLMPPPPPPIPSKTSSLDNKQQITKNVKVITPTSMSITKENSIIFAPSSTALSKADQEILDKIISSMKENIKKNISIVGYSPKNPDKSVDAQKRSILLKRVIAVRSYMIQKGIEPKRLIAKAVESNDPKHVESRIDLF
jgi:outer membrane protein OmpA-like peptidoglycan-associated protein